MILAHVLGIPIEESVLQLVPAAAAIVTTFAIASRTRLDSLRRRLRHGRETAYGDVLTAFAAAFIVATRGVLARGTRSGVR